MGKLAYNYDYHALDDMPSLHFLNYGHLIDMIATKAIFFHLFNLHPETVKGLPYYKDFYERGQRLHRHIKEVVTKRREELQAMSPESLDLQNDILAKILKTGNLSFEYTDDDIAVLEPSHSKIHNLS